MALRVALCCLVLPLSLLFSSTASELEKNPCQYIVRVKTGDVPDAGTDSTISLELKNATGQGITIADLTRWGIMPLGWKYFQQNNLDFFLGRGPCLIVCNVTLTSDGRGQDIGWFLEYVEINITGLVRKPIDLGLTMEQWLSQDKEPYSLQANVDICSLPHVCNI